MIGFIVGCLVGGAVGFVTAAVLSVGSEEDDYITDMNVYDDEEIHNNCTVQVWKNSATGQTSVGWWQGGYDEE